MTDLVDIDDVKRGLRIDGSAMDATLPLQIAAASKAVISYLKGQAQDVIGLDDEGELVSGAVVPEDVQQAVIYLVGHFQREPDGDSERDFEDGDMPRPVRALLRRYRDPALA